MSERKWTIILTLGISSLLLGHSLSRIIGRWRLKKKSVQVEQLLKLKLLNPSNQNVQVITEHEEWDRIYPSLVKDLMEIPIIGFDCEWVNLNGNTQQVSLIQLATCKGICALIRIFRFSYVPETLKEILSNPKYIKVGVATFEDSLKLRKDWGIHVKGVFDVRNLIQKHPNYQSLRVKSGLSGLSEQLLGVVLDKHFSVRCSNWEADKLSDIQIKYAAQDAIASIAVCLKLLAETELLDQRVFNPYFFYYQSSFYDFNRLCSIWAVKYVVTDVKFRASATNKKNAGKTNVVGAEINIKSALAASSLKPLNCRAYAARKSALYDNCILQAPDGQQLCTCDSKKAMWYVAKGRGELLCSDPMTVRLNFEPSGRPSSEYDQYYLLDKSNNCVVCGNDESYLRKNIVPHEYRKHFPTFLKDHKSHDVLLLCLPCHTNYNVQENSLKNELAIKCDAPIGTEKNVKMKLDRNLVQVQRAANALSLSSHLMPEERRRELEEKVKNYYEVEEITTEILSRAKNLEIHIANAEYIPHGLRVVNYFQEQHQGGLLSLEKRWREHFLHTMKPTHLPTLWSVEHNRKPEEKWGSVKQN